MPELGNLGRPFTTVAPALMTVGGTRVPRDGWYSSTMAVGDMRAEGSMEGGSLGMVM